MKKIAIVFLVAVLISSCTMTVEELLLISTATLPPTQISSSTPTDMPSSTPTIPTSTYTTTPTLVGFRSATPTLEASLTPTAFTPFNLITPDTLTPSVVMEGFVAVFISAAEFYKKGCEPAKVKITGQVAQPLYTNFVVLFARFKSKRSGTTSEWTSIGMQNLGAGTYVYELSADEMKGVEAFKDAWVEYQLVATNQDAKQMGRTNIFSEKLTLFECVPTPTPTIEPTATVLKP